MAGRAREELTGRPCRDQCANRRRARITSPRNVLAAIVLASTLGTTVGAGTSAASDEIKSAETIEVVAHPDEQIEVPVGLTMNLGPGVPEDVPRIEPVRRPPIAVARAGASSLGK